LGSAFTPLLTGAQTKSKISQHLGDFLEGCTGMCLQPVSPWTERRLSGVNCSFPTIGSSNCRPSDVANWILRVDHAPCLFAYHVVLVNSFSRAFFLGAMLRFFRISASIIYRYCGLMKSPVANKTCRLGGSQGAGEM